MMDNEEALDGKLCLSGRHLQEVPDAVMSQTEIKVLDLSNNALTQLPDGLKNLTKLTTLLLSGNKLTELPVFIDELRNLTILNAAQNKLTKVTETLKNLQQLSTLILGHNDLEQLAKEICQLKTLLSLDISFNPLRILPKEITSLKRLSILLMAGVNLKELPNDICCLKMLSELDVSCNGLKQVPKNFTNLSQLHTLNLSINGFEEIPQTIFLLKRLGTLDISWNRLTNISDKIKDLSQLTTLHVNGNHLVRLPEGLGKLKNLTTLDVSHNHLVSLPTSITSLIKLNTLLLDSNRLCLIPNGVFQLKTLLSLDAGHNQIRSLPDLLAQLNELTTLQLPGNELIEIPKCVFNLKKLTTLNVSDNCLTNIPEEIEALEQLSTINLGKNHLQELPKGLFRLKKLTNLNLTWNQLKRIPDDINFHRLTTLDLSNNHLEELPRATFQLKALESLSLSSNKLEEVHKDIKNLEQLVSLELSDNCLKELPESVCQLNSLVELVATENQLKTLPLDLVCLTNLRSLRVDGNPLQIPPEKVCEKGWPAIRTYLKEIRKGEAFHQKLVLLGSSGAGKTSLAKTLAMNRPHCVEEKDRTIVMDKISWEIEHCKKRLDVSVIDFGGDDIYKIVHDLFLDENSLILLVVNLQRYSQETYARDLGSWINALRTRVPTAQVILVGTHLDCLESEDEICSRKEMIKAHLSLQLEDEGSNFRVDEIFTVSSKDYQGIRDLRTRILDVVAKNGRAIPSDWIDIYKRLQNLSEINEDQSFLTFDGVKQLVETQEKHIWDKFRSIFNSSEDRTKTILAFFHDIGILLWFHHSPELTKFVFHRAEFLTEVIKAVFSGKLLDGSLAFEGNIRRFLTSHSFEQAKQDCIQRGILSRTLLKALWKDHQIEEKVFDAMVDLFIHLDLCYPMDSEGIQGGLRFPWFLQEGEPDLSCVQELSRQSPSSGCYRLSLKYLYPAMFPATLFHNFVVRLHRHIKDFKSRHDWKNGMYARVKESQVLVRTSLEEGESIITVSVEGTKLMKIWSVLLACHQELTALMKQWPGLRWECWIICPHCMRANIAKPGHFPQSNLDAAKCPKGRVTCDRHEESVPACLVYPLRPERAKDQRILEEFSRQERQHIPANFDCSVAAHGIVFKSGTPTSMVLNHVSSAVCAVWKFLGRQLCLADSILDQIEADYINHGQYEQCYHMLITWTQVQTNPPTYEELGRALQHETVGRPDIAKRYCSENDDEEFVDISTDAPFKEGRPNTQEILSLARKLRRWKRIGRALQLEDAILNEIDEDINGLLEKSHAMLRRWMEVNGSAATYQKLAEGLEIAERRDLIRTFCSKRK